MGSVRLDRGALTLLLAASASCTPGLLPVTADVPVTTSQRKETALAVAELELAVIAEVNRVRAEHSLPPMTVDTQLVRAAKIHAANMARLDTIAHTIPEAPEPTLISRITLVGYPWAALAENLAKGYVRADSMVAGWMASPGHRRNILHPVYHETGIGIAVSARGDVYACQVFAQAGYRPSGSPRTDDAKGRHFAIAESTGERTS